MRKSCMNTHTRSIEYKAKCKLKRVDSTLFNKYLVITINVGFQIHLGKYKLIPQKRTLE